MLVVNQGEVAVIKAYVGLPTLDTSGAEFKFGSIVRPGHRGIWQEPLRTGKYPINPRVYAAEIVPTSILTLNWADAVSTGAQPRRAPVADRGEEPRGLRVPHRPAGADPRARHARAEGDLDGRHDAEPRQRGAAGGGRQPLPQHAAEPGSGAVHRDPRSRCRQSAFEAISAYLAAYDVETRGVYIQDVEFPAELVEVLTQREIANQEKATFAEQERAEIARIEMEKAKGTADMQAQLAQSRSASTSRTTRRRPAKREARGEAAYVELTGRAEATKIEAIGLAEGEGDRGARSRPRGRLRGADRKRSARRATALVAVANAVSDGHITVVPEVLVTGGGGGAFDGLAATLMRTFGNGSGGNGRGGNGGGKPAIVVPEPGGTVVADAEPGETVVVEGEPEARS